MLKELAADGELFQRVKWWVGGKEGETRKSSLQYVIAPPGTQLEWRVSTSSLVGGAKIAVHEAG